MAGWWEDYKKRKGLSSGDSGSQSGKTYSERMTTDEHRQAAKSSTWWEDYKKKNDLERKAASDRQRAVQTASRLKYRSERNQRFASANRQLDENRSRDAAEDEIRELFRNPFSSDAEWQAGVLQRNAERYKRDLPLYQQAMQNSSTWGEYFSAHRQAGESQSAVKHQFERYQQAAQKAEQERNESNLVNRPAQWQAENLTPQEIEQRLAYYRSEAATPTVTDKDREARAYLYPEAALQKDPHGARFNERLVEDAGQDAIDAAYRPILTEQEKAAAEEADRQIIEEKAERNYEQVQRLLAAQAGQTETVSRARGNELIEEIAKGGEAADKAKTGKALFEQQQKKIDEESPTIIYGAHGNYSSAMAERTKRGYILGSDWDNVPEARKQAVYALYTESPEKAIELAKYYIADAQNAEDEERQAWYAQSGWTAALGLASSAAAHLGAAVDPFGPVGQELTRYGDNALAGGSQWADAATGYQKIPEWVPIVGGKGAGDFYQTVGSVVQSAAVAAPAILAGRYDTAAAETIGKLGLALMGSSAAASDYRESVAAGMDEDRAKLHALAAGVEEALFEEVSLDKLIKMDTSGGLKSALKNWLVQSGIEGSEELATSIANRITDELISGAGQSKVERRASELIANGMSATRAKQQAESEWMKDTLYEGFSGFLSGGMMTGGNYALQGAANLTERAVNAVETRKVQKQAGAAVSRSEGSVEALQAYAKDNGIEIKGVETADQNAEQGGQGAKQNNYSARDYRSISDTNSKVVQSIRSEVRGKTVQEQQTIRDNLVEKYGDGIAPVVNHAISIETAARVRQEYGNVDSIQAARNRAVSEIKDESLRRAVSDGYDSAAYSLAASQGGEGGMNTMSRYIQQRNNTGTGEMSMNATVTAQDGSTKTVAITGMSEDGKRVSLADGSEVAVKDLQADADTTSAIQQLADLDLGADATKVLQAYQQSGVAGTEGYRWLMDYATAYNQGRTRQISLEQAAQRSSLDERTVMDAYTLGQQAANRETQAGLEKLKNLPKRKGASGRTSNIDTTEIKGKTMSKSELEQFELANQYAQALGVDMTWFSSKEKDGKFVGKNGAYENGKIYMDIHAGRNFAADLTSGILATMGHELTHFQQQYAPEEYQALKEFLFEQIVKSSPNGEARLERLIWEKQRRSGYTLSRKAAEDEVVADACQKMLRDSKAVHDFASQQTQAANGVIRWLDKWFKKVRSIFGRGGNYSEEAQLMDSLEQDVKAAFGELWDKALKQAVQVHDEVGNIEKTATEGENEVQNSDRDAEYLELAKDPEKNAAKLQEMVFWAAIENRYIPVERYHQTDAKNTFTKFSTANPAAGKYDSETPNGIFLKTNDHFIPLGLTDTAQNTKQMPLFIAAENILRFADRTEANRWYCRNIKGYEALQDEMNEKLKNPQKRLDDLQNEWFKAAENDDLDAMDAIEKREDEVGEEADAIEKEYRAKQKKLLDDYFLTGKSAYDAIELKYDGHRYADGKREDVHTFIVFNPSQVKSADPVTYDDSGNVIPLSERFNEKNEDIRFSMREPVEQTDRLIAWHNMNEDALRSALELGGLAMPSWAIKTADRAHTSYGTVSVIAPRNLIDPKMNRNSMIFGGDAWTPVFPEVNYKVTYESAEKLENEIKALVGEDIYRQIGGAAIDADNIANMLKNNSGGLSSHYAKNLLLRLAYLKSQGEDVQIPQKEKNLYRGNWNDAFTNEQVKKFADSFFGGFTALDRYLTMDSQELMETGEGTIRRAIAELQEAEYKEKLGADDSIFKSLKREGTFSEDAVSFSMVDNMLRAVREYYEKGVTKTVDKAALEKTIDKEIDQAAYEKWMLQKLNDTVERKGIRNEKDPFAPSGKRRSFDALHYAYNLANIVKAMKAQPKQGRTQFLSGPGSVKGAALKSYNTVEQVREDRGRLVNNAEEGQEAYDEYNKNLENILDRMRKNGDRFDAADALIEVFQHAKTETGIYNYMQRELKDWYNISRELAHDAYELIGQINQLPMEYFEGKTYDAVPFDETAAVVVPDNIDPALKRQLNNAGARVVEYKAGDDSDRLAKVNSVEGAQFSERDYSTPSDEELLMNADESTAENKNQLGLLKEYKALGKRSKTLQDRLDALNKEKADREASGKKYKEGYLKIKNAEISKLESELAAVRDAMEKKILTPQLFKLLEAERNAAAKEIAAKKDESFRKYKERKAATDLRGRIKNLHAEMSRDLLRPREGHFVPEKLIRPVVDLLDLVNTETNRAKSESAQARIAAINAAYDAIKKDERYSQFYDETVKDMLVELSGTMAGRSIYDLTTAELEDVYTVMKAMRTTIRNAIKADLIEKGKEIWEIGNEMRQELRAGRGAHALQLLEKYHMTMLSAKRAFNRFGGYQQSSAWNKVYRMLDDAQLKMLTLEMQGTRIFDRVLEGKENLEKAEKLTSYREDDLVDVGLKDETGKAVPIPRGMMLSLYMHLQNEENMRHLMYGGITLPDFKRYYKGRSEAWGQGTVSIPALGAMVAPLDELFSKGELSDAEYEEAYKEHKAEIDEIFDSIRKAIEEQLTDYDRQWIAASREFFDGFSRRELNRVTNEMYGFSKARVNNYFPIVTDSDFLKSEFESISKNISLENAGFMKERVRASNPIYLEDITKAVNRQISNVSRYAGLTQALKTFGNVYNVQDRGFTDSVKKAMAKTYGKNGQQYVENLITDMVGGRNTPGTIFDRVKGNYAQAVLAANLSVTIKQAASFPTAAATVGWGPLMKAMARGGKSNLPISRADSNLISIYSPLLWYRSKGAIDVEIGDIANGRDWTQKAKWLMGWIEKTDRATVGRLWYAAEYYVKDNYNLEKGTEEQIKNGESPFYRKVAEVFADIVEDTQPNYTILQRPDILRNPNKLVRAMVMFSTQRFQNGNILIDAIGEYRAMVRADKQNGTPQTKTARKAARQKLTRAISSQTVSAMVLSAMTLLAGAVMHRMNPWRDDDDELTFESIAEEYLNGFLSSLTGSFLAGSEVYEGLQAMLTGSKYYGNDVGGISTINELATSVIQFEQQAVKLIGDEDSTAKDWQNLAEKQLWKVGEYLSQMTGIPTANIKKIIEGGRNHIADIMNEEFFSFEAGVDRSAAVNARRYMKAIQAGDTEKAEAVMEEMRENYKEEKPGLSEKAITRKVRNALASYIKEQYTSKEISEEDAISYLVDYVGKKENDAFWQIREWEAKKAHKGEAEYTFSPYEHLRELIDNGKDLTSEITYLQEHGKTASAINSDVKKYIKKQFDDGELSEQEAMDLLQKYHKVKDDRTGKYRNDTEDEAWFILDEWKEGIENEDDEEFSYVKYRKLFSAMDNDDDASAAWEEMSEHGVSDDTLKKAVSAHLQKQFQAGEISEDVAIDRLQNYRGMDEDEAYWQVDKWKSSDAAYKAGEDFNESNYRDLYAAIDGNKDPAAAMKELTSHGYKESDVYTQAKKYLSEKLEKGEITEQAFKNKLSRYCKIVKAEEVDDAVQSVKNSARYKKLMESKPNLDATESQVNAWYDGTANTRNNGHESAKTAGMSIENYIKAKTILADVKDANGNRTGEDEYIAALTKITWLTPRQKDALYYERYKGTTKYSRKTW